MKWVNRMGVDEAEDLREREARWNRDIAERVIEKKPERKSEFLTEEGLSVRRLYTPLDLEDRNWRYLDRLSFPGEYPFTRGVYPTMYRGRIWTVRQYAGFGSAEDTNQRYRYLLDAGQTGLSMAFDLPTQLGLDPTDPMAWSEVGKVGVSMPCWKEMDLAFKDIPMEEATTSMTINSSAMEILSMYITAAEARGIGKQELGGTIQNDILKEYIARNTHIYPPAHSMRYTTDIIIYCAQNMPRWNSISISGYHFEEAGATPAEELAFTLANGVEYTRWASTRGIAVDDFARRLSFFFGSRTTVLEQVAKFRAARRIWAHIMKEKFGARHPASMRMRFHVQTAGVTMTVQQPMVNVIRTTIQALAAVLGGAQSLHVNSYDEAMGLPTEEAVKLSVRVQQVLAHESGVVDTVDPLGGSYYLEWLTDEIEEHAWKIIDEVEEMGGMTKAVEAGYPQRKIAESAHKHQLGVEGGEIPVIGVNLLTEPEEAKFEIQTVDVVSRERVVSRLNRFKEDRDPSKLETALDSVASAAEREDENLFPHVLSAVKAGATVGEISEVLRKVWGEWTEATTGGAGW
ncbi:MAG: methylmalonyl-CoA mutase [Candidatus Geothermarchaeales archaeon]